MLLAASLLAALTVGDEQAEAAFPGHDGRIACSGPLGDPPPPGTTDPTFSRLEIFTVNPDGGDERRLTSNTATDFAPKFSPDGSKIAFQRADSHIWTMNADGTGETRLTFGAGTNTPGSWSPDSSQVVFQSTRDPLPPNPPRGSNPTEIYRMNADGTDQTRLTNNTTQDAFPAWSPDGSNILFRTNRDGNPNLYTMNPNGGEETRLTSTPAEESGPAWSPDGSQIAFHTDRDAFPGRVLNRNLEIYRMSADGSGETRLTFSDFSGGGDPNRDLTGYDLFPAWSPEGDRIVFHSGRAPEDRSSGQDPFIAQWEVFTINAVDGSDPRRLTARAGNDERCDWQPIPRVSAAGPPALASGACANRKNGTERDDNLVGTIAGDRIDALGGHDRVDGLQGDDCLSGARGRDRLAGALGNDRLSGGADRDSLSGGDGVDRLSGGAAKDKLNGGGNRDSLSGGSGPDQLSGASDNDRLSGGSGNDRLAGGSGRNRYSAGSGNDRVLAANGHTERINCGSGRRDVALADRRDRVRGCERVRRLR